MVTPVGKRDATPLEVPVFVEDLRHQGRITGVSFCPKRVETGLIWMFWTGPGTRSVRVTSLPPSTTCPVPVTGEVPDPRLITLTVGGSWFTCAPPVKRSRSLVYDPVGLVVDKGSRNYQLGPPHIRVSWVGPTVLLEKTQYFLLMCKGFVCPRYTRKLSITCRSRFPTSVLPRTSPDPRLLVPHPYRLKSLFSDLSPPVSGLNPSVPTVRFLEPVTGHPVTF